MKEKIILFIILFLIILTGYNTEAESSENPFVGVWIHVYSDGGIETIDLKDDLTLVSYYVEGDRQLGVTPGTYRYNKHTLTVMADNGRFPALIFRYGFNTDRTTMYLTDQDGITITYENAIENAKSMIRENFSLEKISELTGLATDVINKLRGN